MAQAAKPTYVNNHPPLALPACFPAAMDPPFKGRNIRAGDALSYRDVVEAREDYDRVLNLVSLLSSFAQFAAADLQIAEANAERRLLDIEAENSAAKQQAIQNSLTQIQNSLGTVQSSVTALDKKVDALDKKVDALSRTTRIMDYERKNEAARAENAVVTPPNSYKTLCFTAIDAQPPLPLQNVNGINNRALGALRLLHDTVLNEIPPRDPTAARLGRRPAYIDEDGPDAVFPRDKAALDAMTKQQVYHFATWYNTNCDIDPNDILGTMVDRVRQFIGAR